MENKNKYNSFKKQIKKIWLPLLLGFFILFNLSFLPNIFNIINNSEINLHPSLGNNNDLNILFYSNLIENNKFSNENKNKDENQIINDTTNLNDNNLNTENSNYKETNSNIVMNENTNNNNENNIQSKSFRYFLFLYVLFITGLLFILIVYKEESNLPIELKINNDIEEENEKNKEKKSKEYDPRKDGYKKLQNIDEYYENI